MLRFVLRLIPSWRNCVRRCRGYRNNYRAESYYRQYSAGTYGDYGRGAEIYLTEQQALAERFNDVPLGSVRKVSSRLIRRSPASCTLRARLGTAAAS